MFVCRMVFTDTRTGKAVLYDKSQFFASSEEDLYGLCVDTLRLHGGDATKAGYGRDGRLITPTTRGYATIITYRLEEAPLLGPFIKQWVVTLPVHIERNANGQKCIVDAEGRVHYIEIEAFDTVTRVADLLAAKTAIHDHAAGYNFMGNFCLQCGMPITLHDALVYEDAETAS